MGDSRVASGCQGQGNRTSQADIGDISLQVLGRTIPRDGDAVSQTPTDQNEKPTAPLGEAGVKPKTVTPVKQEIAPTISAYFGASKISPSAFFKALKIAKIKQFTQSDEAQAFETMDKNDPDAERLWALMSQPTLPEVVDRWIWRVAQERLKAAIGGDFNPLGHDAVQILKEITDPLAPRLVSKEKPERKKAENWLRIGIRWLAEKRSLDPWLIAEKIQPTLFKKQSDATRTAIRSLQHGRWTEFRQAVAMAGLAQTIVDGAQRERDAERRIAAGLRQQLTDSVGEIDSLRSTFASMNDELSSKSKILATTKSQFEAERQHWGHDLSEIKAEQRVLLRERVVPLLSDAVDALEIEPPAPHIALKRLKAVLSIIGGAKQ